MTDHDQTLARRPARTDAVLVVLAAAAGWLDATAYLRVHVFTANMTGNTVLFALGVGGVKPGELAGPLLSIGAFLCGAFVGTTLERPRMALTLEAVVLAVFAVAWDGIAQRTGAPRLGLIGLAAAGMGLQQAATHLLHPQPSVSTTYMSGTVERIAVGLHALVHGKPNALVFNTLVWSVYVLSGACVAIASRRYEALLGIVPFAVVAVVTAVVFFTRESEPSRRTGA